MFYTDLETRLAYFYTHSIYGTTDEKVGRLLRIDVDIIRLLIAGKKDSVQSRKNQKYNMLSDIRSSGSTPSTPTLSLYSNPVILRRKSLKDVGCGTGQAWVLVSHTTA